MAWDVKVIPSEGAAVTSTPPPTTTPTTAAPAEPGGGPDADALARGDFRSVGGINASAEHGGGDGGAGYTPVTVPPGASTTTRMLAPVENVVRAFQTRQGPFPTQAPPGPGEPPDMGVPTTRDLSHGADVAQYGLTATGNAIGAVGDVAGHPAIGTAGKWLFDTVAPLLGGLYGIYSRAAAGEPEALTMWNRAVQGVQDWRTAQGVRAGEQAAARTAQETNVTRTQLAQEANLPGPAMPRVTPRLLDVPEVNPLQTPAPPMATRMLAASPQPPGAPTFAQWLGGTAAPAAGRSLRRAAYLYGGYRGIRALEHLREGRREPGEPG